MTARTARRGPHRLRRAAFTLLELLAVILIIAILVALAFPAYTAVVANAKRATVRTEMAAINTAIADFKSKYNTEPPSYISFVPSGGALPVQTRSMLRKMFPQIDFTSSALATSLTQAGLLGEELKGNEALVFFLGGVRRNPGAAPSTLTNELVGFSKNPANPFAQPAAGSTTRVGPFFEFDTGRLTANPDGANDTGTTPQLVYRDSVSPSKPYIYASTAATGTYRDGTTAATTDFPDLGGGVFFRAYRKTSSTGPFWNPNSYQLIAPAFDGEYGRGGVYDPSASNPLPTGPPAYTPALTPAEADLRKLEFDNLTNFANGPLGG
jgi:prepilin-type N-terminal cleavage/methylation domain-containing protein